MKGTLTLFMFEFCTTTHNYTRLIISSTKYTYFTHALALAVGKKLGTITKHFTLRRKHQLKIDYETFFFSLNNIEEI